MNDPLVTDYARIIDRERYEKAANVRLLKLSRAKQGSALGDMIESPGSASNPLSLASLSTRSAQAVQAYWWVPAGFAVLVLLRTILGA